MLNILGKSDGKIEFLLIVFTFFKYMTYLFALVFPFNRISVVLVSLVVVLIFFSCPDCGSLEAFFLNIYSYVEKNYLFSFILVLKMKYFFVSQMKIFSFAKIQYEHRKKYPTRNFLCVVVESESVRLMKMGNTKLAGYRGAKNIFLVFV